jgi:hypothetical protein
MTAGALRLPPALLWRTRSFTGDVLRFPPRASHAIWIVREREGWLVLAREHGWLHGTREHALDTARWLSKNLGLPIREARL